MDTAAAKAKARRWAIRGTLGLAVLLIVGGGLFTLASLKFAFASGDRVGYVQKLAKRGWLCHTNEGEIASVNVPGQPAQLIPFTVPDDAVAQQIDALDGVKVVLKYEEHRFIPSSCFGDTELFVTGVRKAE